MVKHIRLIDVTLTCTTTLDLSGAQNNGNERIPHIPLSSSIGTSASDSVINRMFISEVVLLLSRDVDGVYSSNQLGYNERVTPHSPEPHNWSHTTRCRSASYPEQSFF